MMIAGVNLGTTRAGLRLKDGGACLLRDGTVIFAIAEERLAREKHAGGFERALPYCLSAAGISLHDLDLLVVSNCADAPLTDGCDIGLPIDPTRVIAMPSHHLSHAHAAFLPSPFDEAAIMIFDNEGSQIAGSHRFEQNSYYFGAGNKIMPLLAAADNLGEDEVGLGEAYRHFTHYLGWHSYTYAGHTMGLAPYGSRGAFPKLQVFDLHDRQVHSILKNGGNDPATAVSDLGRLSGVNFGPGRLPGEPLTKQHKDLASVIQSEFERALVFKAHVLHDLTGATNLCLGGGSALNCVANRRVLRDTPFERIYVNPAPGDTGQSVGNALYGWISLAGKATRPAPMSPFLGREYCRQEIADSIRGKTDQLVATEVDRPDAIAAGLLKDGHVVGWFQGRSELGPRALGARSILADPRQSAMRDYLNMVIKKRDTFRPFASSILREHVGEFFDLEAPSPHMELVGLVRPGMRDFIPAAVHVDGSSRLHTVSDRDGRLESLIQAFRSATGVPLVLNTSFNLSGEPIVESPADAIDCFLRSTLDALFVGDFYVRRALDSDTPGFRVWSAAEADHLARGL